MDSKLSDLNLGATELRLGLPGTAAESNGSADNSSGVRTNKRNLQNDSAPPPKYVPFSIMTLVMVFWALF